MHTYTDVKDMLHKELAEIVKKGELSAGSLETIDKLLNSIKNAHKIIMYEEFGDDGYSRDGGIRTDHSYANRRRDSLGRYSSRMMRDDGYSRTGYSYDDGRSEKVEILREMMKDATSEDERRVINKLIRRMENE